MVTLTSHSPADTMTIGRDWGKQVARGWVIGLSGDLGAGKTQLVKGLAAGLGINARVHSPTFSLVNVYQGGLIPLFHLDLYRLETHEQISSAGLEEYLSPDGVTVIEWAERWFGEFPGTGELHRVSELRDAGLHRWALLESAGENERRILYEDFGA